ncbi:MAG: PH domain-containing protein [Patescibacteria group bacterium]
MITLYPDEKIILERRRFWLPIALQGIVSFFIGLIPFLVIFGSKEMLPPQLQEFMQLYQIPALFFATVWTLIVWVLFFVRWTDYYLDVLLVTNKRVLDIEQLGLFSRDISEARLENIQDMRVEIPGFLATTMNFGNLHIQTAGASNEFTIENIPEPSKVKDAISHQCECLTSSPS